MAQRPVLALLILAGSACTVLAQDSISNTPGLPGDAIDPWNTATQKVAYVADLAPFSTSWGTTFGIVPLVKTPKTASNFFNNLMSGNGISDDLLLSVPYFSGSYALWVDRTEGDEIIGSGVNPGLNETPEFITPSGLASQFAVGLSSFGTVNARSIDNITAAVVNYNPAQPNRLYVTRIETAVQAPAGAPGSTGSLAFGSIDASGNVYFRGDGNGAGGAPGVPNQAGNNLYRTRLASRNPVVNLIGGLGGADATDQLLINASVIHQPPSNIPASVAGGNGLVAGPNFSTQFVRGASAPLTADGTHLKPVVGLGYTPPDHRGSIGTTTRTLLGSGVATTAILSKDNTGTGNDTRVLSVWSTDAAGNVVEGYGFQTPLSVSDPTDGRVVNYLFNTSQYRQTVGVTPFRSGGGAVALGQDSNGFAYAGATMSEFGVSFDLAMQNLAVRFDSNGQNPEWAIIAWTDPAGTGKVILDGPSGARVGNLVPFRTAFPNAGSFGPSMSTPTFDGAGNAWFLASAALDKIDQDTGEPFIDYDTVLIRAVRKDIAGGSPSFGYELELVLELGNTYFGRNAGKRYQIQFLDLVAASGDSGLGVANPATIDHNNGRSWGWNNTDLAGVGNADPITNGGIVISADITYDVNADGVYEDPTSTGNDPSSPDQSYQALLYIGYYFDGPRPCNAADLAEPFGILDLADIIAFTTAFSTNDLAVADLAPPFGILDLADINAFVAAFLAGCP
jgi:hypothetical protein